MSTFSERLKKQRLSKKLRQQDLADAIGITLRAYQFYEKGEMEATMPRAIALADALDVSLDYLAGRIDDPSGIRGCHIPNGTGNR